MSEQEIAEIAALKAENEKLWSMLTELTRAVLTHAREMQQTHSHIATVMEQMKGKK